MATKDYGQTYYATDADAVDVAAISEATAESIEGRTVMSFASTGARDTALATLTTEQKKGVVAHVMGLGLYYYSGSTWRRVAANGENFTQGGVASGTTQATGLLRVTFPTAFGGAPIAVTANPYASVYNVAGFIITMNDNSSGAWSTTGFDIFVKNHDNTIYGSSFISVSWMAIGPRAAD